MSALLTPWASPAAALRGTRRSAGRRVKHASRAARLAEARASCEEEEEAHAWSPRCAASRAASLALAAAVALSACAPPPAAALQLPQPAAFTNGDATPPTPVRSSAAPRPRAPAKPPPLTPEERATVTLFEAATPSVVFITTLAERQDPLTLDPVDAPAGAGSGFFWDSDGHVVTNYHVVKGAALLKVTLGDTTVVPASLVGYDEDRDVAVLQLPPDVAARARPMPLGASADLRVGQRVYAIGNPFGLDHTLTSGVVSGLGREIVSGNTGRPIGGAIQTDAAINPGNSGGPLLNSAGQVVGINTAIYSSSGTSSGVGFALPSDLVAGIVEQLIAVGRVTRPVMGISFAPDGVVAQLGLGGVLVLDAREGGPAARAGVQGTKRDGAGRLIFGDVIVSIDGAPVRNSGDLYKALDAHSVGDTLRVGLERAGAQPLVVQVTLEDKEPRLGKERLRELMKKLGLDGRKLDAIEEDMRALEEELAEIDRARAARQKDRAPAPEAPMPPPVPPPPAPPNATAD